MRQRGFVQRLDLVVAQCADDLGRIAVDNGIVRNLLVLGDQRPRTDDAVLADFRVAEQDGAHADQRVRADGLAVHDGVVANHDIAANRQRTVAHDVDRCVVLDVRAAPDADRLEIAAHDAGKPDARILADDDVAGHACRRRNEDRRIDLWPLALVGYDEPHKNRLHDEFVIILSHFLLSIIAE